ncbi:hypothetical protein DMN91_006781 [Ooceraea biroi]|uniref:Glutaredoxin-related protein 5, mitochondrial n=1 Tax=Ooceraea biroi TaxID=2015173 RepID=A0A3L8DIA9_OOCBI|nr:glutaredoxin-related protein 5, mitochondrial [Ooceraea biroi]RLU20174.1 hypothetical protein DMN91_006781 [Ooceraea biroi]
MTLRVALEVENQLTTQYRDGIYITSRGFLISFYVSFLNGKQKFTDVVFDNIKHNMFRFGARSFFIARNFSTKLDEIGNLVKKSRVVVFMKGVPEEPRCGFSNAVVQILKMHGVTYDAHDVLKDEELRQGIKNFSNWPTIPQVFINGDFVGGCDILLEMHKNGELIEELKKAGITSVLLEKQDSSQNDAKKSKE